MTNKGSKTKLRIGVIGMGAVGTTLAAHLIDAGAYVVPCDIDRDKIDAMKKSGITLENLIEKKVNVARACYSTRELNEHNPDLIVIASKTPSLGKILTHVAEMELDKAFVMCAQNGMDNEREVAELVGNSRTLRMVINYAGGMTALDTVHVAFFNPPNYIASITPEGETIAQQIAELLNSVNLKTEITDNIQKYVWEKVILNAALSPVCAITRLTMKDVMDNPDGLEMAKAIISESVGVAEAEGIKFADGFEEFCVKYLKGGGKHRPSLWVDLENGLKTEIDYLNGKIAEYGKKHGILTPYNSAITSFIHMLELSMK